MTVSGPPSAASSSGTPKQTSQPDADRTPALLCLGGETAKAKLGADLRRLSLLSTEALTHLWDVLGPLIGGELNKERIRETAEPFCERYRLDFNDVMFGVSAARMLLRGAAKEDLNVEQFVDDLETLKLDVLPARALAVGYERATTLLRAELMMGALMDHGNVLTRVDWRIDQMRGSNRGKNINAPVVSLSLNYQDNNTPQRITLQVLPPVLKQLRAILDELLTDGKEDER